MKHQAKAGRLRHVDALVWLEGAAPVSGCFTLARGNVAGLIADPWARAIHQTGGSMLVIAEDRADAQAFHDFVAAVRDTAQRIKPAGTPAEGWA